MRWRKPQSGVFELDAEDGATIGRVRRRRADNRWVVDMPAVVGEKRQKGYRTAGLARTEAVRRLTETEDGRRLHVRELHHAVDTHETHEIECCICNKKETVEDETAIKFVRDLYAEGWRNGESDKFQVIGPMCPNCFNAPDTDRGED